VTGQLARASEQPRCAVLDATADLMNVRAMEPAHEAVCACYMAQITLPKGVARREYPTHGMSGCGTWQNTAQGAACPQLAKADMRAFGRHSGFDPLRKSGGPIVREVGVNDFRGAAVMHNTAFRRCGRV
jgi:hypothetical protein